MNGRRGLLAVLFVAACFLPSPRVTAADKPKAATSVGTAPPVAAALLLPVKIGCPVYTVKIQVTNPDPAWKIDTIDAPGVDTSLWTPTSYGWSGRKGGPHVISSSTGYDTLICGYHNANGGSDFPSSDTFAVFVRRSAPPDRPVCEALYSDSAFSCRALKPGER